MDGAAATPAGVAQEPKKQRARGGRRRRKKPPQQGGGPEEEVEEVEGSAAAGQGTCSGEMMSGSASELVATMVSDLRQAASAGSAKRSAQSAAPVPVPDLVGSSGETEASMNVGAPAFVPSGDMKHSSKKRTRRDANKKRPSTQQSKPPESSERTAPLDRKAAAALEVLGASRDDRGGPPGRRGRGRGRGRGHGRTRRADCWWRTLDDVDPISMEPLSDLRYPPLQLPVDEEGTVEQWFDGRILASYLVATGRFAHPSSRRELGPEECDKIDQYLIHNSMCLLSSHPLCCLRTLSCRPASCALFAYMCGLVSCHEGLGKAQVRQAWECRDQYDNVVPTGPAAHGHPAARLAALRREADSVLRALFGGTGSGDSPPGAPAGSAGRLSGFDRHGDRGAPTTDHSGPSFGGTGQGAAAFQLSGNLGVIDDDVVRERDSNADASSNMDSTVQFRSSFPSLGPASAPRPTVVPKRPPPAAVPTPAPVCTFQDSVVRAEFIEPGTLGVTLTTNLEVCYDACYNIAPPLIPTCLVLTVRRLNRVDAGN